MGQQDRRRQIRPRAAASGVGNFWRWTTATRARSLAPGATAERLTLVTATAWRNGGAPIDERLRQTIRSIGSASPVADGAGGSPATARRARPMPPRSSSSDNGLTAGGGCATRDGTQTFILRLT
jgi:hypothetical protein